MSKLPDHHVLRIVYWSTLISLLRGAHATRKRNDRNKTLLTIRALPLPKRKSPHPRSATMIEELLKRTRHTVVVATMINAAS